MSLVRSRIEKHAATIPLAVALDDGARQVTYCQLSQCLEQLTAQLSGMAGCSVAIAGDNSIGWIMADLALLDLPVRVIPLPGFFSDPQISHILKTANVKYIIGSESAVAAFAHDHPVHGLNAELDIASVEIAHNSPQTSVATRYEKITFTSGSTGNPKGVRLRLDTLENTAASIVTPLANVGIDNHLSVLPYATLLENIAGVYVALMEGVKLHVRSLGSLGFNNVSQLDVLTFLQQLNLIAPHSIILVPQLLMALTVAKERGLPFQNAFKFIAVGGGKVAPSLLERAASFGFPVFEGYGLSECGSVVCLNVPGASKPGSVGKPLSHARISIAEDGAILVKGSIMQGYLGDYASADDFIDTGDLGYIDEEGFVHISGRKKNMFITAFGRNVNPEWIEAELLSVPAILQAAVFGEAQEKNSALLATRSGFTWNDVTDAVDSINQRLPEYAQIKIPIEVTEPFTVANNMLTANGRLKRNEIERAYQKQLYGG